MTETASLTSSFPNAGALYMVWGSESESLLARSWAALKAIHPDLPVHVHRLPPSATLLDKSSMFDCTPFDLTLYLDADTVPLGRLDFGFEMADAHDLACCICECPWARRYGGIQVTGPSPDAVEYNTGVIFFSRKAKPTFDRWKQLRGMDSSIRHIGPDRRILTMPHNDQASFAVAVSEQAHAPFVLPLNWNFRPQWHRGFFGPVVIWHDRMAPPPNVVDFSLRQSMPGAIIEYAELTLSSSAKGIAAG